MPAGGQPYPTQGTGARVDPSMGMGASAAPAPKPAGGKAGGAATKGNAFLQALRAAPPEEFGPAINEFAQGLQMLVEERFGQQIGAGAMGPEAGMGGLPTAVPGAPTSPAERSLMPAA